MRGDRRLERGRVVALAVALDAQRPDVDPLIDRRQVADHVGTGRGQARERFGVEARLVAAKGADRGKRQAVGELLDPVGAGPADRPAAVAEAREHRRSGGDRVVEADLGEGVVLVRHDDGGLRHVLEPHALAVEPVAIAAIDLDADGRVPERHVEQREPGLVLADGSVALTVERAVDQRERPGRRGLLGDDAVAPAAEVQVGAIVADHVDAGEGRAQVEVHVLQVGVLGGMEANRRRAFVARADRDVDVAHRRIERARVGVGDVVVERHAAGRRERRLAREGRRRRLDAAPGEDHHVPDAVLEARRPVAQHQHRPRRSDAEQAHARPDEDRAGEPVAARGQVDDAAGAAVRHGVEGLLDGGAVVSYAVARRPDRDGFRIVGRGQVDRGPGPGRSGHRQPGQAERRVAGSSLTRRSSLMCLRHSHHACAGERERRES